VPTLYRADQRRQVNGFLEIDRVAERQRQERLIVAGREDRAHPACPKLPRELEHVLAMQVHVEHRAIERLARHQHAAVLHVSRRADDRRAFCRSAAQISSAMK